MTNSKRLGKTLVIFSLFIILTLSTTSGTVEYTISSSDIKIPEIFHEIEILEEEFFNYREPEEQLFLIFFDQSSHYVDFLNNFDSELNFNGLMGTIVKTDQKGISSLLNTNSYLSSKNIHHISNENHKFIPHSSDLAINPSIQSLDSASVIGVDKLWKLGYRGEGSTIAVFDEGINASHPDFSFANGTSRIKNAAGFINTIYGNENNLTNTAGSHGTLVAGIAAGGGILSTSNQGMANESWILDVDLDEGPENELDFTILGEIAAINWAIENGVDIINRSYGVSDGEGAYWDTTLYPDMQARYATIRQATKQGVIFVHSAGNEGYGYYSISPDNYVYEITVGATDAGMDSMAPYSSRGPIWRTNAISPDVIAPGTEVPTPSVNGGYDAPQGTSFSAPHVAGVSAILLEAMRENNVEVNPGTIKAALMATATDIGADLYSQGAGQVNAFAAYEYLLTAPRVGKHAIVGTTNPSNLSFTQFPHVLQGSKFSEPFSFVSSELNNISIQTTGNISSLISFQEQQWLNYSESLRFRHVDLINGVLSEDYSHNLVMGINVPENTPLGYYSGEIQFLVDSTEILSIPFHFNVEPVLKKILLSTRSALYYIYNTLGEFKDMHFDLSSQGILLNENNSEITSEALADYDILWLAADNRTHEVFSYIPQNDITFSEMIDTEVTESEQAVIKDFVSNGGGLILTPFSTPLGIEALINQWGIETQVVAAEIGVTPAQLTHFNRIGMSTDFFDASGSYFNVDSGATALAYVNKRENIVMAAYDDPLGGRVVVVSGSDFISRRGYNNEITEGFEYRNTLFNNKLVNDIINWTNSSNQMYGEYEVLGSEVSISLHVSTDFVAINSGGISGLYTDFVLDIDTDITTEIPIAGTNGWYNFSYPIDEAIHIFNFTWNSEFVAFEIITDHTAPVIGVAGMENNSYLTKTTELIFWFRDDQTEINRYTAEMTVDGEKVGFNGPKTNKTGPGYYISKNLYTDSYGQGEHIIAVKVYDIAGNPVSISFIFNLGTPPPSETTTNGTSGFVWGILLGSLIITTAVFTRKKRNA